MYLEDFGFEINENLEDFITEVTLASLGEDGKHLVEFVETDEFMFAMEFVDARKAAEAGVITLRVEADHDEVFALVIRSFVAEVLVIGEAHIGI